MTIGMTTTKIAITVPDEVLALARAAVRQGRGASLSAYISDALGQRLMQDDLDELLQTMLAETGGPLTPAELGSARAALGLPKALRRSRTRPEDVAS